MSKNTNLSFLTDYITADITNGRIGINNASPTVAFDVTGVAKFSSSVTAASYIASNTLDGDPQLGVFTNASTGTSAEATIYIRNGTTSNDATFVQTIGTNFTTTGGFVQDGGVVGTGTALAGGLSLMVRANADMRFYTNGHTNERMRITSAGNVGIGTSSPSDQLHITTTSGNGIKISTNDITTLKMTITSGALKNWGFATNNTAASDFGIYQSTSNGGDPISAGTAKLYFAASGAATFSSSVTALANANSFGTAGSSGQAMFIQAGSGNQAIKFINAAGGDGTLLIQGTSTSIIYRFDTYSTGNAFAISNAGVITIGALGSGTVTSTSGVLSTTSDMTLKVEDGFIDNALEKISQLKPRYFYWKEESGLPTDIRQLGFYAQEVNEALGEEAANTPKNENDKWGIYDRGIIAMLTKGIQELKAEIETLKNK